MAQTLDRVAARFAAVPGRFSEASITRLGTLNHFETFNDQVGDKRRHSLSGSLVVLDIDLDEGKPVEVNVSLASQHTPRFLQPDYDPNGCILLSLQQPRLNQFSSILEFLSRCDRYSTKDVDCFEALDNIGKAVEEMARDDQLYGRFRINPSCIGLALEYHRERHAFLDVCEGSNPDFALVNYDWLEAGEWKTPPPVEHDVRAQLVLRLDPPVSIPREYAKDWLATFSDSSSLLTQRRVRSSVEVPRHPKFRGQEQSDTFDATVANMLPFDFVSCETIPLKHPRHIPEVLNKLRQFLYLEEFVCSLDKAPPIFHSADLDVSIADVAEFTKPTPTALIAVDALYELQNDNIVVELNIPQASSRLEIVLAAEGGIKLNINGPVNLGDLDKLCREGNLALCSSYIVGSLGLKHHRMSVSTG